MVATAVQDCVDTLAVDIELEGLTTTAPESLQEICEHVVGALVTRARVPD